MGKKFTMMNNKKPVTESFLHQQLKHFKKELKDELIEEIGGSTYTSLTETHLAEQLYNLKNDLNCELKDGFNIVNQAYTRTISECIDEIKNSLSNNIIRENTVLQNRVQMLEERIGYLENEREFYATHHKGRRKKLEREVLDIVNDAVERRTSEILSRKSDDEEEDIEDHSPSSKKKEVLMKIANSRFCSDILRNKLSKMSRKNS